MQTIQRHLIDIMSPEGVVSPSALPELKDIVSRYPYYHLARIALLRLLYKQRDPDFNEELRRAALYLPSRETIFNYLEVENLRPREEREIPQGGAMVSRKPNERLDTPAEEENRTNMLISGFLKSLSPEPVRQEAPRRRGRIDATRDYIGYLLQEEMEMKEAAAAQQAEEQKGAALVETPETPETSSMVVEEPSSMDRVTEFLEQHGDKKIKLKEKSDSELEKPVLDVDNSQEKGAFTETLAKIYIKQGKFEHAIEIIRRLSLKYPKKNRYFADQIRFLEKIIANNKAAESVKK